MSFDQDIYFKIVKYLEIRGLEYDDDKVKIVQDEKSIIRIEKWDYQVKKPDPEDLLYTVNEVNDTKESVRDELEITRIAVLKNINKVRKPRKGMIVFCSDDNTLKVYSKDSWKSFNVS